MRVAIVGYGAVAGVHMRGLRHSRTAEVVSVSGPNPEKARRFADLHGIPSVASIAPADVAIICSPSPWHCEQARAALEAGLHVLVELPACETPDQARQLGRLASERGLMLACAHTSRYLGPYERLEGWIREGRLGAIEQVHYLRVIPPRQRSWTDDALLHHAEHPLDLFLKWFGSLRALACAALPSAVGAQNLALIAELPGGAPVSVAISYTARIAEVRMTVAGSEHTVITDGFSFIRSDAAELCWQGDGEETYECAVEAQDAAFLDGGGTHPGRRPSG